MTLKETLFAAGREYLVRVLEQKRGNVSKAAMEAGITRPTMYKYIARYGLVTKANKPL